VPHVGKVIIGDDVEVQSNAVIHRGVLRNTIIGNETKIGSCSVIAHEVTIGKRCIIGTCVSITGSAELKDDVYIAPGVSIINNISIGQGAFIGLASLVVDDVPEKTTVLGHPAEEIGIYKKKREKMNKLL
jgi:UDP-3-O-[3-hydroxymyristoyl] glucosamine N-acyltransferase